MGRCKLDVNARFRAAVDVTGEWSYTDAPTGVDPCVSVRSRLKQVRQEEARVKLQLFALTEILNPQPRAADVVHALLAWVDVADRASQEHREAPPFEREDGSPIFPEGEEWWLTEISKRRMPDSSKDLANDDIAAGNLTDNPSEAGLSSNGSGIDHDDSSGAGEGLPLIPRARKRLCDYKMSASRKSATCAVKKAYTRLAGAAGLASEMRSNATTVPRRRLTKKTRVPGA